MKETFHRSLLDMQLESMLYIKCGGSTDSAILAECHLSHLLAKYGLEVELDWGVCISISEMQRLNFARLFFARPHFCLADECTSALDMQLESMLYIKCAKEYKITMISVAHRPSVRIPFIRDFVKFLFLLPGGPTSRLRIQVRCGDSFLAPCAIQRSGHLRQVPRGWVQGAPCHAVRGPGRGT